MTRGQRHSVQRGRLSFRRVVPPLTHRSLPRTLIVADLNVVEGGRRDYVLPDGVGLVLPRVMFDEVLGKPDSRGEDRARSVFGKLHDLLVRNRGRVLLGRNPGEIDAAEHNPDVLLDARHWIALDHSELFRLTDDDRNAFVTRTMEISRTWDWSFSKTLAAEFQSFREDWKTRGERMISAEDAGVFRGHPEHRMAFARHPARVALSAVSNPKFASGRWAQSLAQFPDRYSWPRWKRLYDWYGLQAFLYPDSNGDRFRNDFEDAQYAHLASHAGAIATNDRGLIETMKTLFPSTRVLRSLP